jgi:hypothetical protein
MLASISAIAWFLATEPVQHDPGYDIPIGLTIGIGVLVIGALGVLLRTIIASLWHHYVSSGRAIGKAEFLQYLWNDTALEINIFNKTKRVQFVKEIYLATNTGEVIHSSLWNLGAKSDENWRIAVGPGVLMFQFVFLPHEIWGKKWLRAHIIFEDGREMLSKKFPVPQKRTAKPESN